MINEVSTEMVSNAVVDASVATKLAEIAKQNKRILIAIVGIVVIAGVSYAVYRYRKNGKDATDRVAI